MIREASLADVSEFFSERDLEVPERLGCKVMVVDESLLVAYDQIDEFTCEVHICAKRKAVRHVKELIAIAEHFLLFQGFQRLITAIEPKYTASIKLVERIGFKQLGCYNNQMIFGKEL
jgi:L-amino acid N-acyltransferase YncA